MRLYLIYPIRLVTSIKPSPYTSGGAGVHAPPGGGASSTGDPNAPGTTFLFSVCFPGVCEIGGDCGSGYTFPKSMTAFPPPVLLSFFSACSFSSAKSLSCFATRPASRRCCFALFSFSANAALLVVTFFDKTSAGVRRQDDFVLVPPPQGGAPHDSKPVVLERVQTQRRRDFGARFRPDQVLLVREHRDRLAVQPRIFQSFLEH